MCVYKDKDRKKTTLRGRGKTSKAHMRADTHTRQGTRPYTHGPAWAQVVEGGGGELGDSIQIGMVRVDRRGGQNGKHTARKREKEGCDKMRRENEMKIDTKCESSGGTGEGI